MTDHPHGTVRRYKTGCHCADCRWAIARDEKQRLYEAANGHPRSMPVLGVQRRVQALACLGWPVDVLSRRLGYRCKDSPLRRALDPGSRYVFRATWEKVCALYDELSMVHRVPTNAHEQAAITRTIKRAAAAGWLPPLAWDDIDADARSALTEHDPEIDPVVVEHIIDGWACPATRPEREEVVRRWRAAGRSLKALEALTGWKVDRYFEREEAA